MWRPRLGRRASAASSSSAGAAPAPRRVRPSSAAEERVAAAGPLARRARGAPAPEPGEISEQEREYREMMRLTKEWMAYDPDELPENYPAPWETHVKNLMEEGPWPCWDPTGRVGLRAGARVHPLQGDAQGVLRVRRQGQDIQRTAEGGARGAHREAPG